MTVIVGIETPEGVLMGGDSAGVSGLDVVLREDPKVFRNGPFLFGITDSFRMGQLLQFQVKPPAHPNSMSDYEYMVTVFVDEVRRCFREGGFMRMWHNREVGGTFLVGYNGRLYSVYGDFQIGLNRDGYASVGCGEAYALGALFASRDEHCPHTRLSLALSAASKFSGGVEPPYTVLFLEAGLRSTANGSPKKPRRKAATKKTKAQPKKRSR